MKKELFLSRYRHSFHLVTPSPWPLLTAFSIQALLVSVVLYLHAFDLQLSFIYFCFFSFLAMLYGWFNDVIYEATYQGQHSLKVQKGLRLGMVLFILSEVLFFFSFFWAFFHSSIAPAIQIGGVWPPLGVQVLNPWEIPLINTILLLSSGVWATIAHHLFKLKKSFFLNLSVFCLSFAVCLGFFFSCYQFLEYYFAPFDISDSVYGSIFYLATGFHGLHVIIGSIFLLTMLLRARNKHFVNRHFFGVEASIWYWHFVDVVWLFLFISIYWWGA